MTLMAIQLWFLTCALGLTHHNFFADNVKYGMLLNPSYEVINYVLDKTVFENIEWLNLIYSDLQEISLHHKLINRMMLSSKRVLCLPLSYI